MSKSIELEDLKKIKSIINEFSDLHNEFETHETELSNMQEIQRNILERLHVIQEKIVDLRQRESLVIKEMQLKYGEDFMVDLDAM